MDEVVAHPRIMERCPMLSEEDVRDAWDNCLRSIPRVDVDAVEYIAIGCDGRGGLAEMIARAADGVWNISQALTPPVRKALRELGMRGR